MFGIGTQELVIILVLALIIIGPKNLPDIAKALGKAFGEFQRATRDLKQHIDLSAEPPNQKDKKEDAAEDSKDETKNTSGE
jgi:sec-independent protein translocase protein TatB